MKKKLLLIVIIFSLFVWVGIKGYQVAHFHAQNALSHMQTRLKQIVGKTGHYSFSDAHIGWLTQSLIIKDVKLSLSDGTEVSVQKVRAIPNGKDSISNLDMDGVVIKSSSLSANIASLAFTNLRVPAFSKLNEKAGLSYFDICDISFEQGNMKGAYFYTKWGKIRLGSWRIARVGSAKKRPYLFYNVDIAPIVKDGQSASWDALHLDQLVWEMSNDRQFNEKEFISSFFTSTDYSLKAFGLSAFRNHKKRLSIGQLNVHLSRQETMWDGEILADKFDYNLSSSFSLFAEYLKRLGYSKINGAFHSNFTYYTRDSLFALHKFNYFGYDFIGFNVQSRFYVDRLVFNPYIINWSNSVLLKSMVLSAYDTGLQKRLFSIIAKGSGKTRQQVRNDTLEKFIEFSKGKDFELDRQFYSALTDILQHPKHMMQLSTVFAVPERVDYLLNMNFLDFFKLINQNNMTITAMPRN